MFDEILPELSFGDNVRPSQVTAAIRDRLVIRQKRIRQSAVVAAMVVILLFNAGLALVAISSQGALPWRSVFSWEAAALAAILLAIWSWHSRRTAFLREACAAPAAVLESSATTLWGIGGLPSWMTRSARSLPEALEDQDEGGPEDVLYIVRVRLRFRPGTTSQQLNWDDLRDEVPHVDVKKWLLSGGWGTFAYRLKRGSLVSLLYSPQNPTDCRIVQRFHSRQFQGKELERTSRRS